LFTSGLPNKRVPLIIPTNATRGAAVLVPRIKTSSGMAIKALPKPKVDRISVEMNIINKTRAESGVKFINLDYCQYLSGV